MEKKMFWTETKQELGKHFELLTTDFDTEESMLKKCELAKKYNLRSFVVGPLWLEFVASTLKNTDIMAGTGAGYPAGLEMPKAKAAMVEEAIRLGANAIDMSMNFYALKAGRIDLVEEEFRICRDIARDIELKAIIEVGFLTDDEIRKACELIIKYDLDWVKSSCGQYNPPTMEKVAVMLEAIHGSRVRSKVSGVTVPRAQNAYAFMMAGVEVIGSQKCDEIIDGLELLQKLGVFPLSN